MDRSSGRQVVEGIRVDIVVLSGDAAAAVLQDLDLPRARPITPRPTYRSTGGLWLATAAASGHVVGFATARSSSGPASRESVRGSAWLELLELVVPADQHRRVVGSRLLTALTPLTRSGRIWTCLRTTDQATLDVLDFARWTPVTLTEPVIVLSP